MSADDKKLGLVISDQKREAMKSILVDFAEGYADWRVTICDAICMDAVDRLLSVLAAGENDAIDPGSGRPNA